jgi:hypothetical protein
MSEVSLVGLLRALAAQLAAFEALLLLASAAHKTAIWSRALSAAQRFADVPASMASAALGMVIGAEVVAAGLLAVPALRTAGGIMAALIWAVYLGLILRAILDGRRDVDCGCSFGSTQRPLGAFQTARNGVLLGIALFVAAVGGGGAVQVSDVLAAFALLALYGALDQVMALQPLRGGEVL